MFEFDDKLIQNYVISYKYYRFFDFLYDICCVFRDK